MMIILTDELYNVVDKLYLRRDRLQRMIDRLQREQHEIYQDMEHHDIYMLFIDLESELENIIEDIEVLENQVGVLECLESDFNDYSNFDIEDLKELAEDYKVKNSSNRLDMVKGIINKIYG